MFGPTLGRTNVLFTLALVGAISAPAAGPSAETHPFSIHDMLAMDRISEPQLSPDGRQIVFTLRVTDLDANKGLRDLWRVGVDGSGLQRLTTDPASDSNPRWLPDGKAILFLSSRSGTNQVWRIPAAGGDAVQVSELPLEVTSMHVSPDGERIAVSMDVFPDCLTPECTAEKLEEIESRKTTGRTYIRLFVRHWDTWKDGRRSHVFTMPSTGGDAVDVMRGMDADCPTKPFGGPEEYTFSPDGKQIVFTARIAGREEAWSTDFDILAAPADGSNRPARLTERNRAWDTNPVFSPDGKWLAYLAMERPGYESDRRRIILRQWPGGRVRVLTQDWDRSPGDIVFSADGKTIYTRADNLGQRSLFAVDVESGDVRPVVEQGTVRWVDVAGDRLVFSLDHLRSPVELYSARHDGSDVQRVTRINDEKLAATRMGEPEQFSFKGWNDETVYGYVVKPVDFDPQKKWPIAFLIHGGPQGSFGNDFHYRWNPQAYTGAGYAAVMIDFHGSVGYGQAFTDSIGNDWGGKPLEDLQKGLAAALERYPWLSPNLIGALGASYGGYMINWIAGNWPDRFRCLINHDGNLDELMAYYNTEELWFPEWERGGTPWKQQQAYQKHSPINYVANWKTPMLVIHGALDYRVVDTQGIATFTALQRRGIPSKLLYFPDENHWVLKPHNSIQWHEEVIGWLDLWIKQSEAR